MTDITKRFAPATIAFSLLIAAFVEPACASSLSQQERQQVDRSIHLFATYLSAQIKSDGSFEYRRHIDPAVTPTRRYNMLRHAGAIYALADYLRFFRDKERLSEIGRAVEYLLEVSVAKVGDRDDMLAVWSDPEVTGSGKPLTAKLGGTGLALVAMISCRSVKCTELDDEVLRRLGRFILFMQRDDGSFFSKYTPSEGGKQGDWVSLYYPGEAALGLVMLFEITGEKK